MGDGKDRKRKRETLEGSSIKPRIDSSGDDLKNEVLPVGNSNSVQCSICQDTVDDSPLECLPCCHSFHSQCISTWLRRRNTCPVCRTRISEDLHVNNLTEGGTSETGTVPEVVRIPNNNFAAINTNIAAINTDMAAVNTDMAAMHTNITAMNRNIAAMNRNIAAMHRNITAMHRNISAMHTNIAANGSPVAINSSNIRVGQRPPVIYQGVTFTSCYFTAINTIPERTRSFRTTSPRFDFQFNGTPDVINSSNIRVGHFLPVIYQGITFTSCYFRAINAIPERTRSFRTTSPRFDFQCNGSPAVINSSNIGVGNLPASFPSIRSSSISDQDLMDWDLSDQEPMDWI